MQVYFIRHGQSVNNSLWEGEKYMAEGRMADPPLTQKGLRQAEITGDFLALKREACNLMRPELDYQNRTGFHLTHLYCSLMERALQTGVIIAEKIGLPLIGLEDVHEIGGIYHESIIDGLPVVEILHGLGSKELAERYPTVQLNAPIPERGWWLGGKEPLEKRVERVKRVIQFIKDRHGGTEDRVGIVTHGSFTAQLYRQILHLNMKPDIDYITRKGFVSNNCSITRVDDYGQEFLMMYFNRADHLPDELIT